MCSERAEVNVANLLRLQMGRSGDDALVQVRV